jgi:hypothetical protein
MHAKGSASNNYDMDFVVLSVPTICLKWCYLL